MDKRETPSPDHPKVSPRGTAIVIFGTIADTTWRLFTPVIGLLLLGMWLDDKKGDGSWFALIGIILGTALGFLLVRMQYKQVVSQEAKHD